MVYQDLRGGGLSDRLLQQSGAAGGIVVETYEQIAGGDGFRGRRGITFGHNEILRPDDEGQEGGKHVGQEHHGLFLRNSRR